MSTMGGMAGSSQAFSAGVAQVGARLGAGPNMDIRDLPQASVGGIERKTGVAKNDNRSVKMEINNNTDGDNLQRKILQSMGRAALTSGGV